MIRLLGVTRIQGDADEDRYFKVEIELDGRKTTHYRVWRVLPFGDDRPPIHVLSGPPLRTYIELHPYTPDEPGHGIADGHPIFARMNQAIRDVDEDRRVEFPLVIWEGAPVENPVSEQLAVQDVPRHPPRAHKATAGTWLVAVNLLQGGPNEDVVRDGRVVHREARVFEVTLEIDGRPTKYYQLLEWRGGGEPDLRPLPHRLMEELRASLGSRELGDQGHPIVQRLNNALADVNDGRPVHLPLMLWQGAAS
jgi:hypothetical protein